MNATASGSGPRVVVYGVLGQAPFAGTTWQVLHYLEGFRRLGLHVTYVEDTGEWPYDPVSNVVSADPAYTLRYLKDALGRCSMDDHWFYRCAPEDGALHGGSERELTDVLTEADVLVNVTGATVLGEEHLQVPIRVYLETDPVLPEIEIAEGAPFTVSQFDAHTHIATFGENLGAPDCGVPLGDYLYIPTRQPVVVDWWARSERVAADAAFTTVASWRQTGKDVTWRGETYTWSKHLEFEKVLDLPARVPAAFTLALSGAGPDDIERLGAMGWRVEDALRLSGDPDRYRRFLRSSRGEFTVAKDQNVRLRSGWFSDRSACYLAAGLPVVTQETGFSNVLPTGSGLFGFVTVDDAAAALEAIEAEPDLHSRRAHQVARECFEATTVLADLLSAVGAPL
jgi:hypothetical protein